MIQARINPASELPEAGPQPYVNPLGIIICSPEFSEGYLQSAEEDDYKI